MSNNNSNNYPDTKIQQVIIYIQQLSHIKFLIDNGKHAESLGEMTTFLDQFEIGKNEKDVYQAQTDLDSNYERATIPSYKDLHYWKIINEFSNRTFRKGFRAPIGEEFFDELEKEEPSNDNLQ